MYSRRREGISLQPTVDGPAYEGKANGDVCYIDTSAILGKDKLHVFATNRSLDESAIVHVELVDRPIAGLDDAELLTGPDVKAANSFEQPDLIRAQPLTDVQITDGQATVKLPPISVAAISLRL
jgi:alpha-N-arabinofuranosidase